MDSGFDRSDDFPCPWPDASGSFWDDDSGFPHGLFPSDPVTGIESSHAFPQPMLSNPDPAPFPRLIGSGGSEPPPSLPGTGGGEDGASSSPPRKKNAIKKGDGKDAREDEFDHYNYLNGRSYPVMREVLGHSPKADLVLRVCKRIRTQSGESGVSLSYPNRWAKRRCANALAWLDRNQVLIPEEQLRAAVRAEHGLLRY
jgi:hypothetical protein